MKKLSLQYKHLVLIKMKCSNDLTFPLAVPSWLLATAALDSESPGPYYQMQCAAQQRPAPSNLSTYRVADPGLDLAFFNPFVALVVLGFALTALTSSNLYPK